MQNISFYKDAALATDLSADADWRRRGLYIGPQFDHLDVNVQEEFDEFLAERGIDQNLAMFLPEYAEYKEQKVRAAFCTFVERAVQANHAFDPGIRRLATERQEVHRGVKSSSCPVMSLYSFPVFSRSSALVLCPSILSLSLLESKV